MLRPDPNVWDGRHANNGWLQELPRPLTKLTWDNAAIVAPATAARLGLASEDVVELRLEGRALRAPLWVQPGMPEDAVLIHLGYGRARAGRVGDGAGVNAYALRAAASPWNAAGLELVATGARRALASTQTHHGMEGRDPARERDLDAWRADPRAESEHERHPLSLYPGWKSEGHAWGLSVDLGACIGCNACVVACQAENNIPIVGREQVARGREMHWIRIDRYYRGGLDQPRTSFQPVMCQHCETAPCETVCPVAATTHSPEGLNEMTYNRCVGTRYCSNNCPYKVRRFNFLEWRSGEAPLLRMQRNPDVTVRSRGVMEKCSYCVQRINAARIQAKLEDRPIRDGEVVTACQAACPTAAIVFGDLNEPASAAARARALPRAYGLLAEIGTRPRTSYLTRVRNPNAAMPEQA
jgi:molybdopterin-containing oxidoreductase family iron-sulfur binding subunit